MSVRVVVAEDSLTARKRIVMALEAQPGIEVVGEAKNGKEAIEMVQALRPDVLTLDMVMPQVGGLAVTEYLMALCPTPILIVSIAENTYEARAAGAVALLDKAPSDSDDGSWEAELAGAVRTVALAKVAPRLPAELDSKTLLAMPISSAINALRAASRNG